MKFLLIIFFILFNSFSHAASFNCHYGYKNKNNIINYDVFSTAYVEVNTFLKKLTFYNIKMEHMKKSKGIKLDTLNIIKTSRGYRSEKFKQSKLSEVDQKKLKKSRDYYWPEVKDEYLKIYILIFMIKIPLT